MFYNILIDYRAHHYKQKKPAGFSGRQGSLVTAAGLGDHPLVKEKELCLHRRGKHCLMCVQRCPVGAVSETTGIHRKKCWARLKQNLAALDALAGLAPTTHVCGKCQVLLPCSLGIPQATANRLPA